MIKQIQFVGLPVTIDGRYGGEFDNE